MKLCLFIWTLAWKYDWNYLSKHQKAVVLFLLLSNRPCNLTCNSTLTISSCDLSTQLLFSSTSLWVWSGDILPIYFLWPLRVDNVIVEYFKFLSYGVQKLEFLTMSIVGCQATQYTNPSYIAGWPSGLATMSVVGGQKNNSSQLYYWRLLLR